MASKNTWFHEATISSSSHLFDQYQVWKFRALFSNVSCNTDTKMSRMCGTTRVQFAGGEQGVGSDQVWEGCPTAHWWLSPTWCPTKTRRRWKFLLLVGREAKRITGKFYKISQMELVIFNGTNSIRTNVCSQLNETTNLNRSRVIGTWNPTI